MEPVSAGHVAPLLITCGAHVPCSVLVVLAECPAPFPLLITCGNGMRDMEPSFSGGE